MQDRRWDDASPLQVTYMLQNGVVYPELTLYYTCCCLLLLCSFPIVINTIHVCVIEF